MSTFNAHFEGLHRVPCPKTGQKLVKIGPGDFYISTQDEQIVTVLGSCIAACIRDPYVGVAGMNHFMLPLSDCAANPSQTKLRVADANRYGNYAMEHLINEILKRGGRKSRLEVKIFGGGNLFNDRFDVGRHNIEFIENYLRAESIPVLAKDLGGKCSRRVVYHLKEGIVKVKRNAMVDSTQIIREEKKHLWSINQKPVCGEVELFD